ncbi:DUF1028 domain-containing protein [Polaromonas sp.]|uniref:DUF1028 domain-containing protein n=1 Tax=Polaromonas sp. TaxID=1869339 RepID=UPI003752E749
MNLRNLLLRLLIALPFGMSAHAQVPDSVRQDWDNTFSIVARDPATGALGGAVSTARLSVGNRVLQVEYKVGAVASQANTNPLLARDALERLRQGGNATEALDVALRNDERREERQLSVIDAKGIQAAFTGSKPDDFKGHLMGKDCVVAGNILVGRETLEAMRTTFEVTVGTLADRLMAAMEAGQKAGGDRRGKISAAIVVLNEAPSANSYARNIDLRIDSSTDPVSELRGLYEAYKTAFRIK